jgi:hypothetical protein
MCLDAAFPDAVKISAYSGRVCLEQGRKENGTAKAVPTNASDGRDQKLTLPKT